MHVRMENYSAALPLSSTHQSQSPQLTVCSMQNIKLVKLHVCEHMQQATS